MKTIYCDGIFDLFHHGHLQHIAKIHILFDEPIKLLVGVISDEVATKYKRKPTWDEHVRTFVLNACVHVAEAFVTDILIMDEAFLEIHNIDYVVHAFTEDKQKQSAFFEVPVKLGKFIEMNYNTGVSTSQIIKQYDNIESEEKEGNDQHEVFSYDLPFNVQDSDKVLLVGSYFGGNLGTYRGICLDINSDRNPTNNRHGYPILPFSTNTRIFKDKYFDCVFYFGDVEITPELYRISKCDILFRIENQFVSENYL